VPFKMAAAMRAALLVFELAKFPLHFVGKIAQVFGCYAVRKFARQLAIPGEPFPDCLFFPIPVHIPITMERAKLFQTCS
jgi:hypothetical protein